MPVLELPAHLPSGLRQRLALGQRLDVDGGRAMLACHAWGADGAGPAVLLLHGASGSWTHWLLNILPLVDAGRRVLAVDLPGLGDSDPAPDGSDADAMARVLAAAWPALTAGQPVDLVGFSLGALVAGRLLAVHAVPARQLVLVGAPAMGVPRTPYRLRAWRHLSTADEQLQAHRHNLGALMLHQQGRIDALALEIHSANTRRDRLPYRRPAAADLLARSLQQLHCPVHAIYGAHDALYGPGIGQLPAAFAAAAADFRGLHWIEGAGHWVQFEAPQAFDAALQQALAGGEG